MTHDMQTGLFLSLVVLVAIQRILELAKSRKHALLLQTRGGFEVASGHFLWMRLTHAGWLFAMVIESLFYGKLPGAGSLLGFGFLFALGQALRIGAMETLGVRWTARIYCLPHESLVTRGLYRYFPHPNYAGVVLEIFSLPMLFGCWRTALTFSLINAAVLAVRIPREAHACRARPSVQKEPKNA